jgi:hypothetical protein
MPGHKAAGSCLCGKIAYEITGNLGVFQYCHCSRCRKFTGSAHASNVFVAPGDFHWLKGEEYVGHYNPGHTKYFATAFCKRCGSSLPWLSKSGRVVVVPAGTLDDDPGIRPDKNIFCASRAEWYTSVESLPQHDEGPPR